ncbi:hypothetical protein ABPG74_004642 [Tetrahymena malaccensis]
MGGNQSFVYSVPVSEKKQGETAIYRHVNYQKDIVKCPNEKIQNLQDLLINSHSKFKDREFVGKRDPVTNKFTYKTYGEEFEDAKAIGSSIKNYSLAYETKEYKNLDLRLIGINSRNRIEWNTVDWACALYNYTLVPFYDTLGPETTSYVFEQTQMTTCFCSQQSIKLILQVPKTYNLKNIVSFDDLDDNLIKQVKKAGFNLLMFKDLIQQGKQQIQEMPKDIKPDQVFTFSYTSGTTGLPKGVMLTHRNFVSIIAALDEKDPNENDNMLCFLPLPHSMQRIVNAICWYTGTKIAFFGGDIQKLKEDLQDCQPTLMVLVPRLFNRFYEGIQNEINKLKGFQALLVNYAIQSKLHNLVTKNQYHHMLYDKLVFNKMKQAFGGKIRLALSASAPISTEILNFFKIVLGCPIYEAYGQTEGLGLEFCTSRYDVKAPRTVGGVCGQLEMKLIDVPEMNYLSTDKNELGEDYPRGEICVRGSSVFAGYYKDEEKTKEAIDGEGWLHSGDIGCLWPSGSLQIIDRKKNIFKLSQGEYIAPEKVENIYCTARGVQEAFLYGDSLQNYCVGIIVPNPKEIKVIAKELNIETEDLQELCKNKDIIQFYQKTIVEKGKACKLFTFEQALKIYLEPKSFISLGICSSSFKLIRFQAREHYKEIIKELYTVQ